MEYVVYKIVNIFLKNFKHTQKVKNNAGKLKWE